METLAREGGHTGPFSKYFPNVLLFGAVQLLLSQVPSLDYLEWASIAGAVASFGYSFAALGLSARFARLPLRGSAWGAPGGIWVKLVREREGGRVRERVHLSDALLQRDVTRRAT